jgi:hypothetical protein
MTKMNVQITVKYIPLPPEKKAAWDNSMRLLGEMLLEIYAESEQFASSTQHADFPNDKDMGQQT